MATVNLKSLAGKLNPLCTNALQQAAALCSSRSNFNVELEHWFLKLAEPADGDFPKLYRQYGLSPATVNRELTKAIDALKTGNGRQAGLSPDIQDLIQSAWLLASIEYGAGKIRSSHLLLALLTERNLAGRLASLSPELCKVNPDKLKAELLAVCRDSSENVVDAIPDSAGGGSGGGPAASGGKTPALDQFTTNLTARAKEGKLDAVIGRDFEIRQVIDILTRRRQNNPILVGEAGVGKTAVVEGFAVRIASGDVPEPLKNVDLRALDLGLLQAGAGVKGEFENRLKSVIQEVQSSPKPIILFIDEAHTLIGAGGAAGAGDAANLLKPALARGELRTVAATTFDEYKKSFEDDPALKRRFQLVRVEEPDRPKAVAMMRAVAPMLEKHHGVRITLEAIEESVRLSQRYIPDRQLPDKSVSLLDTACAKVALSQSTTPAQIEDTARDIDRLNEAIEIMTREMVMGINHEPDLSEKKALRDKKAALLTELQERLKLEREKVKAIQAVREKLEKTLVKPKPGEPAVPPLSPEEERAAQAELEKLTGELRDIQGESPLVHPVVTGQAIAEVVAGWTGIPMGRMVRDEIKGVLQLGSEMKKRVVGQDHALDILAERVQTSRAKLTDPRLPIGVFMLVGPSGTGKTETAITLADLMFGGESSMTVINMSEYKTEMMVSRLTGPAPGLVGYGKGGVLTEAVRRRPNSLVLLDEIEKAHPSVHDLFFQVFDKGSLTDEKGQETDFKNTIILLTSNVATDKVLSLCEDPDTRPNPEALMEAIREDMLKVFKDAFLGRITVLPYYPLSEDVIRQIIGLKLGRVRQRLAEAYRATLEYSPELVELILSRCKEVRSGARNVDRIINVTLLPEASREILGRLAEGKPITKLKLGVNGQGSFTYELT